MGDGVGGAIITGVRMGIISWASMNDSAEDQLR